MTTYKGKFSPTNPTKYKGNFQAITYRSGWELKLMLWLDRNKSVKKWSSEETIIPYFWEVDGKKHRYFMDFWVLFNDGQEYWFEVKPKKETIQPVITGKNKKRQFEEAMAWSKNKAKWDAAIKLAPRNVKFRILTEDGLRQMGIQI